MKLINDKCIIGCIIYHQKRTTRVPGVHLLCSTTNKSRLNYEIYFRIFNVIKLSLIILTIINKSHCLVHTTLDLWELGYVEKNSTLGSLYIILHPQQKLFRTHMSIVLLKDDKDNFYSLFRLILQKSYHYGGLICNIVMFIITNRQCKNKKWSNFFNYVLYYIINKLHWPT